MEKSIKSNKTEIFERMSILKALLIMGIPTIISQLITMIYNLADTMFIGKTDDPNKVAAITIVSIFCNIAAVFTPFILIYVISTQEMIATNNHVT